MRLNQNIRTWIAASLLLVFLFPFVIKVLHHHHHIEHQDVDSAVLSIHASQQVCEICQFDYISFVVVDFIHHLELIPVAFKREAFNVRLPFVPPLFFSLLRAPPATI